jgi:hypothetical protein
MKQTHKENKQRKNPKTNFTLLARRTKCNWPFNEDKGGKCVTVTGHSA